MTLFTRIAFVAIAACVFAPAAFATLNQAALIVV